jgi:hypothetical protein
MFKVGQKVVCINATVVGPIGHRDASAPLVNGRIYTVSGLCRTHLGNPGVSLAEIKRPYVPGFRSDRFAPVIGRKTDISIFTAMLTPKRVTERA